jgi:hypothetical protein
MTRTRGSIWVLLGLSLAVAGATACSPDERSVRSAGVESSESQTALNYSYDRFSDRTRVQVTGAADGFALSAEFRCEGPLRTECLRFAPYLQAVGRPPPPPRGVIRIEPNFERGDEAVPQFNQYGSLYLLFDEDRLAADSIECPDDAPACLSFNYGGSLEDRWPSPPPSWDDVSWSLTIRQPPLASVLAAERVEFRVGGVEAILPQEFRALVLEAMQIIVGQVSPPDSLGAGSAAQSNGSQPNRAPLPN